LESKHLSIMVNGSAPICVGQPRQEAITVPPGELLLNLVGKKLLGLPETPQLRHANHQALKQALLRPVPC
jgi:hypothetical protein